MTGFRQDHHRPSEACHTRTLDARSSKAVPVRPESVLVASHLALIEQMDRAFAEQGRLDPATWLAIDAQLLEAHEAHELTTDEYVRLHEIIENRLGRASLLGWS